MASELNIDAIEQRANAATEPPWKAYEFESCDFPASHRHAVSGPDYEHSGPMCADCEFTAHARTDIPALIARVRELEAADTEVSRASIALAERVRKLETDLARWQRYASYLDSAAKCGDYNALSFEGFVAHNYAAKGAADAE